MAKGNMQQFRREPSSCQTRPGTTQPDAEVFSLVQNSDYEPPKAKRSSKSRPVEEPTAPLKSRIALGYLKVNGHEEPVFAPIQGFEHLFAHADVPAPWPQQSGETQATEPVRRPSLAAPSAKPRSRKRRRTRTSSPDVQATDEDREDPRVSKTSVQTFSIGDVGSLRHFYATRFRELTMKPMRDVVTAWVKRLEPKRQKKYGPYQRYDHDTRSDRAKSAKPPWWPAEVPYVEPSHLKLEHLVPLAVDIMLIHRRIDEEVGKRKYPSWIDQLQTDAVYLISSKDTEHFSSSKGTKYNEAMKKRALDTILPSIFDIAKSHEDYIAQYDLYEGSGNADPRCGKQVSWQVTPRPDRGLVFKRPCRSTKVEPLSDDEAEETEVDEDAFEPSSTLPSSDSTEEALQPNSGFASSEPTTGAVEPRSTISSFDSTLSSFDSAFSYTEDVKMFPDHIPKEPSPAPHHTPSQSLYHTPNQASKSAMVSTVDRSMDRLHLCDGDSQPHSTFSINPATTDLISHCPTGLPYAYSHYPHMAQAPFPMHEPNGFATCGPVVPHNIATVGGPGSHGLPNSSQMHGLPMHQMPTHGYPTHGLPFTMDWINEV